jgi:hypothetical protein
LVLAGSLLIFIACDKRSNIIGSGSNNSNIEIGWYDTAEVVIVYQYASGVLSGYYFEKTFKVLYNSGEVTLTANLLNDTLNKKTYTLAVEQGKKYKAVANVSINGASASIVSPCATVVFNSPNSNSSYKFQISNNNGCPKSVTIVSLNVNSVQ